MGNNNIFLALLKKEILEVVRDRRALTTFAFMVFGFPLLYIGVLAVSINKAQEDSKKPLVVNIYNSDQAGDLKNHLRTQDVTLVELEKFDRDKFIDGQDKLALVIGDKYDISTDLRDNDAKRVTIYVNQKEKNARKLADRLQNLLGNYSRSIGVRRLLLQGVNPNLMSGLAIKRIDLHKEDKITSVIMQLLGAVLTIACFMSTIYLSVDLVAGEKVRNSLEPLLVTPNPRAAFLLPKLAIVFLMVLIAMLISTFFYTEIIRLPAFQKSLNLYLEVDYKIALSSVLIYIPLALLGASIQVFISTIAKSVKEAQGYASAVGVAGMMPSILAGQIFDGGEGWTEFIPSVSQGLLMEKIVIGKELLWIEVMKSSSITVILGIIFIYLSFRVFKTERIFQRGAQ